MSAPERVSTASVLPFASAPDGVPEFYSPTALHARSMLLQARFLTDAAEIERLSRLIAEFSGLQPIEVEEPEEEAEDKNLSTWHTKE